MILVQFDCRPCDVRWQGEDGSICWCCGEPGVPNGQTLVIPQHLDGMTPEVLQALFSNSMQYDID